MSWLWLFLGACAVGVILYLLIYAEDHWLDQDDEDYEELQNKSDSDSNS